MNYLLGIDIGTTSVKTLLITTEGEIVNSSVIEYPISTPYPCWAEQNPQDWWNATVVSIKNVAKNIDTTKILGVGLSGQMHGSVFLDKENKILRPCILWCDQRTAKECEFITEKIGKKKLIELVSNPALTGFTVGKILWVKNNEPETYNKIHKVLLPKDYIRFCLTGEYATEVSDASGTLLFDVKKRKWSEEMLKLLDIPLSWMPDCFESHQITGKVNKEAAKLTGLVEGTPVVGGGGDQAAQAVGSGIVEPGIISITIGTSGVVFAFSETPEVDPEGRIHTFCHAVEGKWHVMGVMLSAGGSLRWFRDNLGQDEVKIAYEKKVDPYEILLEGIDKIPSGSEGLIFLPYLSGERTPHADPYARGVFFGLTLKHTKKHMVKSVLEGVSFGLRDSLEIIKNLGIRVHQVRISGGGAKSKIWCQILADIINTEIVTITPTEGAALGVALLAGVGTKVYPKIEDACKKIIKKTGSVKPDKNNVEKYEKYYQIYCSLYHSVKETFKKL